MFIVFNQQIKRIKRRLEGYEIDFGGTIPIVLTPSTPVSITPQKNFAGAIAARGAGHSDCAMLQIAGVGL